jgi:hypothetical protein
MPYCLGFVHRANVDMRRCGIGTAMVQRQVNGTAICIANIAMKRTQLPIRNGEAGIVVVNAGLGIRIHEYLQSFGGSSIAKIAVKGKMKTQKGVAMP